MSPGRILAAVAAALLVAAVTVWRRRLGLERTLLALAAAVALSVYASGLLTDLPDPEKAIEDLAGALGGYTYVLVGGMAFLETGAFVGLVAPGEFTVILGGVIAGEGEIAIVPLIGLVWLCAILGDTTSFLIGRRLGRGFMLRHGPRLKITRERLEQVEGYFHRHGGKTILLGRFIGLVRAIAPFIAGSSRMPYGRFLPYSIIGTGLWAATFSLLGFIFYRSFSEVARIAGRATLAFGLVVGTIAVSVYAYRRLRHERERRRLEAWIERQGRRPALRPVAAVVGPVWRRAVRPLGRLIGPRLRFLAGRLTPGNLGIEFTTAVATAAAGLYAFAVYTVVLARDPGPTTGDREVLDILAELRVDQAVEVVKVVTELGSLPVVGALVLLWAVVLAARRRPAELVVLVAGLAAIYVAVHLTKAGIDRPRPPAPLAETDTAAFPSGHTAYSTSFVAMAVIAARILPGLASQAALVLAALALTALVGLSRVYLHVHYWSDVVGGWGLGFGIFGACAAVALVVVHIRQTGRPPPRPADKPVPAESG